MTDTSAAESTVEDDPLAQHAAQHAAHDGRSRGADRRRVVRHVRAVAATEYRLAVRGRWALALTGLFTLFGAMIVTFSGSTVGPDGTERIVASLTSLATYLVPLAALALGYDAIVGREAEGWLAVVFSLPIRRGEFVAGTYLGRLVVLAGATVLGFGFTGFLLVREFGVARWGAFVTFLVAAVAVGAAFLAIAVLLSTVAREKTHALGLSLLVWVWFVLVHDLLALGVIAAFTLPDTVLSVLVVANPASVFRVLVLSGLGTAAGGGFTAVLADTGLSAAILAAALLAWCVAPVVLAVRLVDRRRL
ncbi:ABC transporter permease subunit [Halorubrum sp. JWXQ-INN 858]|uniref:ABC transporter permease n=1 Tax=Halorubrum sp. JWXQ-INN 858 TaxID=2690782 RepID=UPI00135AAEC9|nr:ABC transporter permease subunit [Halorubrum sp. JWXQ-INN 858]MWV65379.1 ABC transporter permease subunit [Halorubrum sp. JWXQ-INN 858]